MSSCFFLVENLSFLSGFFKGGIVGFYLEKAKHQRSIALYLLGNGDQQIKIQSVMTDLEPRFEIGSLVFAEGKSDENCQLHRVAQSFNDGLYLEKLVYRDEKFTVESGLLIKAGDGRKITILPGAFPYTIEILTDEFSEDFQPEYPVDSYKREKWIV